MKGQEYDICDLPFDGYYAPQVEIKRRTWGCPLSRHHKNPGFGRPGFDQGPENHGHPFGPDHQRFGFTEDGNRRPDCRRWGPPKRDGDGPSEHHFQGHPGFRAANDGKPQDFHGHGASSHSFGAQSWWFGRRGPAATQERPWAGPWGGPGPDQRS